MFSNPFVRQEDRHPRGAEYRSCESLFRLLLVLIVHADGEYPVWMNGSSDGIIRYILPSGLRISLHRDRCANREEQRSEAGPGRI